MVMRLLYCTGKWDGRKCEVGCLGVFAIFGIADLRDNYFWGVGLLEKVLYIEGL
jgi:hypothetical protein